MSTAINLRLKRCVGFLGSLVLAITPDCMNLNQAGLLKISGYYSSSVLLTMIVGIYSYRRITRDLKELGEGCGPNRVLKIMKNNGIAAVRGYMKHKSYGHARPQIVLPNHLNRKFVVNTPDTSWVTDITYIRTWQGSQYSSGDWHKFCQKHNLIPSMSRRGLAQYTAHGIMLLLNPFLAA